MRVRGLLVLACVLAAVQASMQDGKKPGGKMWKKRTKPKGKETVAQWKELYARNHLRRENHLAAHIRGVDKDLLEEIETIDASYQAARSAALARGGSSAKAFLAREMAEIQKMKVVVERFKEQHKDLHKGVLSAISDIGERTEAIDAEEKEAVAKGGPDSDSRLMARQKERAAVAAASAQLDAVKGKSKTMEDRVQALNTALHDAEMHVKRPNDKTDGYSDGFKRAHQLIKADLKEQAETAKSLEAITLDAGEEDTATIQTVAGSLGMLLALGGLGMLLYAEYARKQPRRSQDEKSGLMDASRTTTRFGSEL